MTYPHAICVAARTVGEPRLKLPDEPIINLILNVPEIITSETGRVK